MYTQKNNGFYDGWLLLFSLLFRHVCFVVVAKLRSFDIMAITSNFQHSMYKEKHYNKSKEEEEEIKSLRLAAIIDRDFCFDSWKCAKCVFLQFHFNHFRVHFLRRESVSRMSRAMKKNHRKKMYIVHHQHVMCASLYLTVHMPCIRIELNRVLASLCVRYCARSSFDWNEWTNEKKLIWQK